MSSVYSHPPEEGRPGVELVDHLADVASRVEHVVPADASTPADEPLQDVVETLAYVHDIGKATTYFQEYLLQDSDPEYDELRHHAPIGSFTAFYALDARGFETETCLAGFVAVAKHHGSLPNVAAYVHSRADRSDDADTDPTSAERQQTAIANQINNIDEHAPDLAAGIIEDATNGAGGWTDFRGEFRALLNDVADAVRTSDATSTSDSDAFSASCYGLVLRCWGALVLADKTSAAGTENDSATYGAEVPSADQLTEHVQGIEENVSADPEGTRAERLNHYRSRARTAVLDSAESFAEDGGGVATLTLPTGMGKTLTGLSAALDLRDRLGGDRVVYALPFTSIIDQVVDEVAAIYDADLAGRLLTAHHHLAETSIEDDGDHEAADRDDDVAAMLAESWRAGLTVTTFVQLFESLAGPTNRQSMKLPALQDAVVVLDEPQSLPLDWWTLAPRLVEVLTEQYGATVIAMTATQPGLFGDATELVDDVDAYFDAVERVTYELAASTERYVETQSAPESYDDAADALQGVLDSGNSALAVCNTIDSTRELTDRLTARVEAVDVAEAYADELAAVGTAADVDPDEVAERVAASGSRAVLHLSTRLRPADRLTLVETAKQLTRRDHPLVAVSTQLVEAGVDISFDRVYRDLAPIDSIVQAAGRCNRSFERDCGRVTVWWLDAPGDQQTTPAEAVYNRDVSLLPVAADTLDAVRNEAGTLSERAVARTAVERYYSRLHDDKDVGRQAYADHVDAAEGNELAALSLIDQRRSADVLVCRTDADRQLVDALREAHRTYDFQELDRLRDATKPLRVSVPYYREDSDVADAIRTLPPLIEDEGLYELDVRDYGSHFDRTKGFVLPDGNVDHQFL